MYYVLCSVTMILSILFSIMVIEYCHLKEQNDNINCLRVEPNEVAAQQARNYINREWSEEEKHAEM